ncbi:MAG: hypothetical protein K0S55_65, partial [Clostridia bacterium]|nr:hypothetical protein [Clostridia bacterium]
GVIHISNHHTSPGKKLFTWGYGNLAENWEDALTDNDGPYAELMASSYSDDQPDFTWIQPYETKNFSQYWYPIHKLGTATFANLNAAIAVEKLDEHNILRLVTTRLFENAVLRITAKDRVLLEETITITPGECKEFKFNTTSDKYTITLKGYEEIFSYTEESPDYIHIPENFKGVPSPNNLKTPQDLHIAGLHIDQYRDPVIKPDAYWKIALEREPEYLPALTSMGAYCYKLGKYDEAMDYLKKAMSIQNRYNHNPADGTVGYLTGLVLFALGHYNEAYNIFYKAAWSGNTITRAMTFIAAIDCRRKNFKAMLLHSEDALAHEIEHPVAGVYAAIGEWKTGGRKTAIYRLDKILTRDPLNHLARFIYLYIINEEPNEAPIDNFYILLKSDPSQTCLDVAFDLINAGLYEECIFLLSELIKKFEKVSPMVFYTLGSCYFAIGEKDKAAEADKKAPSMLPVAVFPYRLDEIAVLERVLKDNPNDGIASYLLGCILYDKKHFEKAAGLWENAIKHSPSYYIPYRNLSVAYYSHLNRREESIKLLKKALELHPGDMQLLKEISFVMAHIGIPYNERLSYLKFNLPKGNLSDDLTLELVKANNAAGNYDEAVNILLNHIFVPGEGGEHALAEQYMFAKFAAGRKALAKGDYENALELFRQTKIIPENLHAGLWNKSILAPYRYYEAESLSKMGRSEEAKDIVGDIMKDSNSGMWNMGGEFAYYTARCAELSGNYMKARDIMRHAVSGWEHSLESKDGGIIAATPFFLSFCDDSMRIKKANLTYLLGYGKLYHKDTEGAKKLFNESLKLNPDNINCALELEVLS